MCTQGIASALNDLSREVGGALGIAVIGGLLTAGYRGHLHLPGLPATLVDQARNSLAVAARVGGATALHAHVAFVDGLNLALISAAVVAALAATLTAVLLTPQTRLRVSHRST